MNINQIIKKQRSNIEMRMVESLLIREIVRLVKL